MVFYGIEGETMREAFKAFRRRSGDKFWDEVLTGDGLFVGEKTGSIEAEWYPKIKSIQHTTGEYALDFRKFGMGVFDFVVLDGRLEHEKSILTAAMVWMSMLKNGGHLVITVPDSRLYECDMWPSKWSSGHQWAFNMPTSTIKHQKSIDIVAFAAKIPGVQIRRIHLADSNYNYDTFGTDQTKGEAEASIEVVLRKFSVANGKPKTFKHSGARGDLIYVLPAIKQLGGGKLYVNRKNNDFFGHQVDDGEMRGIVDFLKTQSYISEVEDWSGQEVDVDLDKFRDLDLEFILLSALPLIRFGVSFDLSKPWIETGNIKEISKADIIVSRTSRYQSPFDWGELALWLDRTAFIGTTDEHDKFVKDTGLNIRHEVTNTWFDLVQVIRGSKLFVGNQSFAYSMAEAMKHPRVLEVCSFCPNCDPQSENGHVRLSQMVIRKYLLGEEYQDKVRVSRQMGKQVNFYSRKAWKDKYDNVSCVIYGSGDKVKIFKEEFETSGIETIVVEGVSFELAMNQGAEKATRRIICFVDANLCWSLAAVMAVISGMISLKSGMMATSTSQWGCPHVSGPCFAVSRDAYEKVGLFNLSLRPGEAGMVDMEKRYLKVGIQCRSVGIPGWQGRMATVEDNNRNLAYLERNFGVKV